MCDENKLIKNTDVLFLFDVDGTLTPSREVATPKMRCMLKKLRQRANIAFVGGSDLEKQVEQIGEDILEMFDYGFPENGVQFYRNSELVTSGSILEYLGNENYNKIVNRILRMLSEIEIPVKRGVFIEQRLSMVNVSPIGRSCSKEERRDFFKYDEEHGIRRKMCDQMNEEFKEYKIQCVIGGQISIDIFPKGWDKTYALQHIKEKTVLFFGDMTQVGGNDYEIYSDARVKGFRVANPDDTFKQVNEQLRVLGIPAIDECGGCEACDRK